MTELGPTETRRLLRVLDRIADSLEKIAENTRPYDSEEEGSLQAYAAGQQLLRPETVVTAEGAEAGNPSCALVEPMGPDDL